MSKYTRWVMCADSHGDMIDPVASDAFLAFVKDYKPTLRIHLGDAFDFRSIRKGASPEERSESMKDDWEQGSDFIRRYFDGNRDNVFLRGNHDERIYDKLKDHDGAHKDLAARCVADFDYLMRRTRVTMLPYDSRLGIWKRGHLKAIHGYASGRNAGAVHARVYRNCFYGHTHAIRVDPVETDMGPMEAVGIGALCKIDMPYNSRQTNKLMHNNGWAYGVMFADGTYQRWQATRIGNNFYASKEITVY